MTLTPREHQAARLARLGYTNEEIAEIMGLSKLTVKHRFSSIYRKLGIATGNPGCSRARLAVWYVEENTK